MGIRTGQLTVPGEGNPLEVPEAGCSIVVEYAEGNDAENVPYITTNEQFSAEKYPVYQGNVYPIPEGFDRLWLHGTSGSSGQNVRLFIADALFEGVFNVPSLNVDQNRTYTGRGLFDSGNDRILLPLPDYDAWRLENVQIRLSNVNADGTSPADMAIHYRIVDYWNQDIQNVIHDGFVSGLEQGTLLNLFSVGHDADTVSEDIYSGQGTNDKRFNVGIPGTYLTGNGVIVLDIIGTDGSYNVESMLYQLSRIANWTRQESLEDSEGEIKSLSPGSPQNLTGSPGDGQVDLSWDHNSKDPRDEQEIYVDNSLDTDNLGAKTESQNISGLNNGQTYLFFVVGVNEKVDPAIRKVSNILRSTPIDSLFPSSNVLNTTVANSLSSITIGHNDNIFCIQAGNNVVEEFDRDWVSQATHSINAPDQGSHEGIAWNSNINRYVIIDSGGNVQLYDSTFTQQSSDSIGLSINYREITYVPKYNRYYISRGIDESLEEIDSTFNSVATHDMSGSVTSGFEDEVVTVEWRADRDVILVGNEEHGLYEFTRDSDGALNYTGNNDRFDGITNITTMGVIIHEGDFWWAHGDSSTEVSKLD